MNVSAPSPPLAKERLLFITGRLAERQVRRIIDELRQQHRFHAEVHVTNISVAALMQVPWLLRKLDLPELWQRSEPFTRVILPGWCQGDIRQLNERFGVLFELGPREIQELPWHLGGSASVPPPLDDYDIEIIAEINHAPRWPLDRLLKTAEQYREQGADIIDLGCIPGQPWSAIGEAVRRLRDTGLRVSVDSFDRQEVEQAVASGAELVLSANSSNLSWARQLPVEWVVIPDDPQQWTELFHTARQLSDAGRPVRLDPILNPIGFGFAESLGRYYELRRRWPEIPALMGVGNVTELSEVDSAGIQFLLAAICQELNVGSVLTTQVATWCQGAIKEFDQARRLVKYALQHQANPKRIGGGLVMLRDTRRTGGLGGPTNPDARVRAELEELARGLTDANYRIFVEQGEIHVMNRDGYWRGDDPFQLFESFSTSGRPLDAAHAFYLGYELSKARTALTLGKRYTQDESLNWGWLTVPEQRHRHQESSRP